VESAQSPLVAADGAPPQRLQAATRFDLRERPERRPAAEWRELHLAQGLAEWAAETGPPAPGLVPAPPAPVQCAAVESGSPLERPEPVRSEAASELALGPASLRPRAAAVTAPFSPAPFPFPAPAEWQVPSEQQAALPPAVAVAVLDAKASAPQAGGRVVVPRPAVVVAKAARREEAEPREARVAPVAPPWVLPSALPWAAAWAFRRGRLPLWPALRPVAWSVRAMEPPRTAGL
jgi:hypothetical protein